MVVLITNVTDGPGKKPREVRVYNKRLRPGQQLRVDAKYVDAKVRKLEDAGYIVLGAIPAWYADYSAKRQTRNLSSEQVLEKLKAQRKREADKAAAKKVATKVSVTPPTVSKEFSDSVDIPTEEVTTEKKRSKKNRNRG